MYGHGYELFCLASDKSGKVIASACKAAKAEHAQVNKLLFDSKSLFLSLLELKIQLLHLQQVISHLARVLLNEQDNFVLEICKRGFKGFDPPTSRPFEYGSDCHFLFSPKLAHVAATQRDLASSN